MKILLLAVICIVSALAAPSSKWVPVCEKQCQLPKCQCSSKQPPISGIIPQFVVLSFDDSATELIYEDFIEPVFLNRKNAGGCPISGTFFLPHEYTDYSVVNKLYNHGFEIASHSITKNNLKMYWQNATREVLVQEMAGQCEILSKFANIPKDSINGSRLPQLQLNEHTFEALASSGFSYDSSWPTMNNDQFFPYSLDFQSNQDCLHVNKCQVVGTPGLWSMPIIDWISQENAPCNSIDACATLGNEIIIYEWMKHNFRQVYLENRAPFSLRINYSWYIQREEHKEALLQFLNYLENLKDVYIVSYKQVLDWSKNPTETFNACQKIAEEKCIPRVCKLSLGDSERYMTVCGDCPDKYPWLGNPLGKN